MFERFRHSWEEFKAHPPGVRFQWMYQRRRAARRTMAARAACLGAGLALSGLGLVLMVAPGPGLLLLAIGAGLVAEESALAARGADWLDVRARRVAHLAADSWRPLPWAAKGAVIALGLALALAAGFAGYQLLVAHDPAAASPSTDPRK